MSKKALAQTYTEAGHDSGWNWLCTQANRRDRRERKLFTHRLVTNPDLWDNRPPDRLKKAGSGYWDERHDSRWRPAKRWLGHQVGRNWNRVYSDLCNMTQKGGRSHRLKESLLRQVHRQSKHGFIDGYVPELWLGDFYIDGDGILCQVTHHSLTSHGSRL